MSVLNKIGNFIDRIILPDSDKLMKKLEKNKHKKETKMLSFLLKRKEGLEDVILDTYEDKDYAHIYRDDYESLIKDLKERQYISPNYQEDVIRKDMMLSFYTIKDTKGRTWFLVVDITNSPNIGIRDYWEIK